MFGDNLKSLREAHNMRQSDLAQIIGVTAGAVGNYEQNSRLPRSQEVLQKIAQTFGVSLDFLMDIESPDNTNYFANSIDAVCKQYNLSNIERSIIEHYVSLNSEDRANFSRLLLAIASKG